MNDAGQPLLLRPRDGRLLGGVCSAIARRFGLDATLVRGVWIFFALLGIGLVLYLLLWLAIPQE